MRFKVLYDGLYTFVLRLLNVACAAGLGILTARLLGPAGKGTYALPSVEAGLVASAFGGLGSALSYFLLNRNAGRRALPAALWTSALFLAAGAAAIVPIAFFAGQRWAAIPAMLSLPGSAAVNLASGYALGVKRVRYSTSIGVGVTVVTAVMMTAGLLFISRTATAAIVIWILALSTVGAAALAGVVLHARSLTGEEPVSLREFLKFSTKIGFVNLISLLNYRADLYIVATLTNVTTLGFYTVAVSAAESLLIPTQVASLVTSPHIGSLEEPAAAALASRCVRNNLIVALLVCVPLALLAAPLIRLLYGTAFLAAVPVLQVLLVGVVALSLSSPLSTYFTLKRGRPEVPLWLASGSAAICIALSFILVPRTGMIGAAAASTLAYICAQVAAMIWFSRSAGVPVGSLLLPTSADLAVYRSFGARLIADGRSLLRAASTR